MTTNDNIEKMKISFEDIQKHHNIIKFKNILEHSGALVQWNKIQEQRFYGLHQPYKHYTLYI